jgi:TolB-like protein/Tfp pilus assembly protein PilF
MPLSPGARLGPYEILAPLGAGGMGEVYRARDKKLDRDVAVKVLPQSVAADPDSLARFEREAKAVAALSHQNILAIHDFGNQDGVAYAVMELLEGETLRGKLDAGPITQKQAVDYALQVAKGLSAAHEKGIVHRDLKPENLFVSRDGHLKILDFGLAKRVEAVAPGQETSAPTGSGHTEPGMVMGTMGYMSPEQVKGFPVDHRSDIFSFGTILYELLSGKKAFKRDTNAETMAAILLREPPEFSESGRNVSPALERIVKHCLEKDRDHRFQTARDIAFSLSEQFTPAATSSAREIAAPISSGGFWVAVLPFKCGTTDADVLALADGLSEEIVTGLSRFRYLSVVSNASAAHLKGEGGDERALGARLGARYVLEGSLRRGGSDLRVSAQLVDAQTGAQLWSETYRRDLQASSLFAVQDDVAGRIVATVADSYGVLVHSIRAATRQKDDVDLTPVEWQFQYFAYREQITPSSHAELKSRLERVAERNDRKSDLWACLAQIYLDEYAFGFRNDATSLDRALAAARRAVELDRANQFALVALAQTHFFRQDLAAFGPAAERAMALNALNTDALGTLGLQIVHTGEFERGTAIVRRAMELNANHAGWMHFAPLWDHFHKGEYEQALECANRVDVPGLFWPFLVMASACGHLGRRAEAQAAVRDLLALDPEFAAHARSNVATWHFASGLMEPILEGLRKAGLSIPAEAKTATADSGAVRTEDGFWIAVLPLKYAGAEASLTALAEGLTEEIVTGLSRFSYLKVITRSATVSGRSATELGAKYVMEGSLRHAGTKLRVAMQLVDAVSGAHLWAENYERAFRPEAVFELQDELVPRIVSTVADMHGVLPRSMSETLRSRSPEQLSPYEAVLRSFSYFERVTRDALALARAGLELAVRKAPDYADAWAILALLCVQDYAQGFELQPDSLASGLAAARRAVDAAPSNPLASFSLAQALFFQREFETFRNAAERAVALNPMDGNSIAFLGELLTYAGHGERGLALAARAKQLNPNHPGWYWYADYYDAYRRGDDRRALSVARKIDLPGQWASHAAIAAACGQLGEVDAARKASRELLRLRPGFAATARRDMEKWFEPGYIERAIDGWHKAGLEIDGQQGTPAPAHGLAGSSETDSGAARADEGFWIAVLPFKYSGADPSLTALAEGLTEEIVTGLSRFSYLRVIARSAAASGRSGVELGARYVMEGSLRQAGTKLRFAVQLVDAVSGANLWAENYERPFDPEAVFELQDELVPRIVSTVADMHGVLPRSMSETVRSRPPEQLSPYEAVLRSFGYFERASIEELAAARSGLESAVRKAPAYAEAWAMLSILCTHEYGQAFDLQPDSLTTGVAAARRAVDAAPSNPLAWFSLAQALFFQKELQSFRNAAERAVALNPIDGDSMATLGGMLTCAGDRERGMALADRAKQLNPHHPGWYWWVDFCNAYLQRDYRGALGFALKMNMPGHWFMHAAMSAAYGQLGERAAASRALQDLLEIRPDFAATVRMNIEKWWEPEFVEHLIDGWRKAGLEIAGGPS